jgi:hypothetical protein
VVNLVNAPGRAVDGSIDAFGQGYVVAYRALPSLGVDAPRIVVAFVNQFGRVVHRADLAETTEAAGEVRVGASADGRLLVAWTSARGSSAMAHALELDCPGALQLCGGAIE